MLLPLALADAGWAVVGAVSGGLIGAGAGGVVDLLLGGQRERKLAKAGARLVAFEIAAFDSQLEAVEQTGQWWRFQGVEMESWGPYKDVLATKLTNEEFDSVSQSVMVLDKLNAGMQNVPAFRNDPDLAFVAISPQPIKLNREVVARGYNALARLGGHEAEGRLLTHESPQLGDS